MVTRLTFLWFCWSITLLVAACDRNEPAVGTSIGTGPATAPRAATSSPTTAGAWPADVIRNAKECVVASPYNGEVQPEPESVVNARTHWQVFFRFRDRSETR